MSTRRTIHCLPLSVLPNTTIPAIYRFSFQKADAGSDDDAAPSRSAIRGTRTFDAGASKDELDSTNLMQHDEASKKFRKAEKRRGLAALSISFVRTLTPTSQIDPAHTMRTRRRLPIPPPQSSRQPRALYHSHNDFAHCRQS